MAKRYAWTSHFIKADPTATGKLFEQIRREHDGKLLDVDIVKSARPRKSPIHKEFEWDDRKAAHKHRCYVARKLQGNLRVVELEKGEEVQRRVYVNVKHEGESFYTTVEDAFSNEEYRVHVRDELQEFLEGTLGRCEELAPRFDGLTEIIKALRRAIRNLT